MTRRKPTKEEILEALKIYFNTQDVIVADEIYDGENAFVVDDVKFITVFESASIACDFYENVIIKNENTSTTLDLLNRTIGKNNWKKYVDEGKLSDFMISAVNGKNISYNIKYEIQRRPVAALNFFFDEKNPEDKKKIDKILLKFVNKEMLRKTIDIMIDKLEGHTIYVPATDSFVKAYDWSKVV